MMKIFVKVVDAKTINYFSEKALLEMFDRVLNRSIFVV